MLLSKNGITQLNTGLQVCSFLVYMLKQPSHDHQHHGWMLHCSIAMMQERLPIKSIAEIAAHWFVAGIAVLCPDQLQWLVNPPFKHLSSFGIVPQTLDATKIHRHINPWCHSLQCEGWEKSVKNPAPRLCPETTNSQIWRRKRGNWIYSWSKRFGKRCKTFWTRWKGERAVESKLQLGAFWPDGWPPQFWFVQKVRLQLFWTSFPHSFNGSQLQDTLLGDDSEALRTFKTVTTTLTILTTLSHLLISWYCS